jgi:hypothetical protein
VHRNPVYKLKLNSMMKSVVVGLLLLLALNTVAQKPYVTSDGELILGFANIDRNGVREPSVPRLTLFFHGQSLLHIDRSSRSGFFTGLSLRNVGFIYEESDLIRKKFRTYNLGIPVALKFGNMDRTYVYAGYELEIPFNYKEKTFVSGEKVDKFNNWFSNRVNPINHTVFVGVRLPYGTSLRFKYYLTPFFNEDFETLDALGQRQRPYQNFNAHLFYFSIVKMITKGKKLEVLE